MRACNGKQSSGLLAPYIVYIIYLCGLAVLRPYIGLSVRAVNDRPYGLLHPYGLVLL